MTKRVPEYQAPFYDFNIKLSALFQSNALIIPGFATANTLARLHQQAGKTEVDLSLNRNFSGQRPVNV